jgi:protein-tyrosine phosphatase family protein
VTEVSVVVVCGRCQVFWPVDGDAKCVDPEHHHRRHELHRHRNVVVLPDGAEIVAMSFDDADPYARVRTPDYGLYLDGRWQPPWPHDHLDWRDFGVPEEPASLIAALRGVLDRVGAGERVEIGCLGGHGRTGTALACLAVLSGHPPADAVAWVRANYCAKAVETDEQAAFVAAFVA